MQGNCANLYIVRELLRRENASLADGGQHFTIYTYIFESRWIFTVNCQIAFVPQLTCKAPSENTRDFCGWTLGQTSHWPSVNEFVWTDAKLGRYGRLFVRMNFGCCVVFIHASEVIVFYARYWNVNEWDEMGKIFIFIPGTYCRRQCGGRSWLVSMLWNTDIQ